MRFRRLLLVVALVAGVAAALTIDLLAVLERVEQAGPWAPLAFGALYVVGCVLLVPAGPMTMAAGLLFGVVWGTVVVSVASVVGASLGFLLGRTLLRERVEGWAETRPRWRALDRAIGRFGGRIVLLARLSPVVPFTAVNYLFGVSRIGFWTHLRLTWIGALPGTVLYVYLGAALTGLSDLRHGPGDTGDAGRALFWVGLAATLAVTVLMTRLASQALRAALDEAGSDETPFA